MANGKNVPDFMVGISDGEAEGKPFQPQLPMEFGDGQDKGYTLESADAETDEQSAEEVIEHTQGDGEQTALTITEDNELVSDVGADAGRSEGLGNGEREGKPDSDQADRDAAFDDDVTPEPTGAEDAVVAAAMVGDSGEAHQEAGKSRGLVPIPDGYMPNADEAEFRSKIDPSAFSTVGPESRPSRTVGRKTPTGYHESYRDEAVTAVFLLIVMAIILGILYANGIFGGFSPSGLK